MFEYKYNLSNSSNAESQDIEIEAECNNMIFTWWERNQIAEEALVSTRTSLNAILIKAMKSRYRITDSIGWFSRSDKLIESDKYLIII
ncbi:MAG: hypothetical protein WA941_01160 [Nitrososphaeraceae archaeon]|jgi:hypothetical protein